jgi:HlyD family secretion protein
VIDDVTPLVSATGVVTPSQWATLSMTASGIVDEVLVSEGDAVGEGQVLARLKGREELQAAITTARFEVASAQKALDDLSDVAHKSSIQTQEAISIAAKQVRDAQYMLDNFTIPPEQENMTAMQAVEAMRGRLDQARTTFEPYKFKSEYDSTRKKFKEDLDEAQSDYNAAVRRLEYETALEVAMANLDQAQEDYATWKAGPDPADVTVAQARLDNANAKLAAAEAALQDRELKAPFSGTVSELFIRRGEWITLGQPVLMLADLGNLRVETTDLNEIDAARVHPGDSVILTFDALPEVVVNGVVQSIAPKAAQGSGVNYTVIIEPDELPETLRWGMTAFADITVQ